MMVSLSSLVCAVLLCLGCVFADDYTVEIVNNVAPCSNGDYSTISLFIDPTQQIMKQGTTYTVQSSQISVYTGLGIQENGQYCHYGGPESGCIDPDNAGMQLWITSGNCESFSLADPFYCGSHPPNAKTIVNVSMSGTWPSCVATLTRFSGAPNCVYNCTGSSASSASSTTTSTTSTSSAKATTTTTTTSGSKTTTTTTSTTTTTATTGKKLTTSSTTITSPSTSLSTSSSTSTPSPISSSSSSTPSDSLSGASGSVSGGSGTTTDVGSSSAVALQLSQLYAHVYFSYFVLIVDLRCAALAVLFFVLFN